MGQHPIAEQEVVLFIHENLATNVLSYSNTVTLIMHITYHPDATKHGSFQGYYIILSQARSETSPEAKIHIRTSNINQSSGIRISRRPSKRKLKLKY